MANAKRREQSHGREEKTSVVQVGISFLDFKNAANLTPVPLFASSAKRFSSGAARKGFRESISGATVEPVDFFNPLPNPQYAMSCTTSA
jgi:hypothetical protein